MRARALVGIRLLGLLLVLLCTIAQAASMSAGSVSLVAAAPTWSNFQPTGWVAGPSTTCSVQAYNQAGLLALARYKYSTDSGATWSNELDQGLSIVLDQQATTAYLTVTNLSLPESVNLNQNQIQFSVWDGLGLQTWSPSYAVRIDNNPPNSLVATAGCYGSNWPGYIAGTASDVASGVNRVDIRLRRNSDGWYYTGSSWQSASIWLAATGTVSWSFPFVPGEDGYVVQSRATDAVGRQQTAYGEGTFSSDSALPQSSVATAGYFNAATWPGTIAGSASDAASGVAVVHITLRRAFDGLYYNGTSWSASATWLPASGTSAWSFSFAPAQNTSFTVRSRATDNCGNAQTQLGEATFTYDSTPPQSSVSTSGCLSASTWPGTITGLASDALSGVDHVEITLRRTSDGRYYNGSSWVSAPTWMLASGTTSWSFSFMPGVDTTYTVNSRALDRAGNAQSEYGTGTFTYDSAPPGTASNLIVVPAGWSKANSFSLTWSNPADLCGIAKAHYKWDAPPTSNNDESPGSPVAGAGISSLSALAVPGEGAHRIYLWLEDAAGNLDYLTQAASGIGSFRWDATPPTTSVADITGSEGCDGWFTSAVEVRISAVDATSGISATFWRQDGGNWLPLLDSTIALTGEGAHSIEYYSVDTAGNTETPKLMSPQVKIDTEPPMTQAPSYAGSLGQSGWYVSSVSVALTAVDATSGISATYRKLDAGPFEPGGVFTVITDGVHSIQYYSIDRACNQEATQTAATLLKIDKTHPTTSYQIQGVLGQNECYVASPVTVTLLASDTITDVQTAGVSELRYRVHPDVWQQSTYPGVTINLSLPAGQDEVLRSVEYYAVDVAGNVEPLRVLPVCMDRKAPGPIRTLPTVSPSDFTNTNCFTLTWRSSDNPTDLSGIGGAFFSFTQPVSPTDGTFVAGIDITTIPCLQLPGTYGDGEHDAYVWLRDRAGNSDHLTYRNVKLRLDRTPPQISAAVAGNRCGTADWYNSCVTVTLQATDVHAGMVGGVISYHVNSGSWTQGDTYIECRDGIHMLEGRAVDAAGNPSDVVTVSPIKVDQTAPAAPIGVRVDPADWTPKNMFTITWINPGDVSGLAGLYYKQGSIPISATDGIHVDGVQSSLSISNDTEGEIPLYIWLEDKACNNNHRNRAVATLKYDSTPPVTTFSLSGAMGGDGWYISPVQVRLTGEDTGSGWASSSFRIANADWQSGTSFTVDAEGAITFSYYSGDRAGNIEAPKTGSLKIDRVPPGANAYASSHSPTTSFTVYWDGNDASSGIACFDVQYRVGKLGSWQDWMTCLPPGQSSALFRAPVSGKCYYFRARATDRAGNVGTYASEPDTYVCVDVLRNGDFEQTLGSEWVKQWIAGDDGGGQCTPYRDVVPSQMGGNTYAVALGCPNEETGRPMGQSVICQSIDVPQARDWPAPVLHFRYHIYTHDVLVGPTTGLYYDSFNVGFWPTGQVQPTYVYTDGNRTGTWGILNDLGWRDGAVDLRPYAGTSVKICLANVTRQDRDLNTWTFVDDIRMVNLEQRRYLPMVLRAAPRSTHASQAQLKTAHPGPEAKR